MQGYRLEFYSACENIANARGRRPDNQLASLNSALADFREFCASTTAIQNALTKLPKTMLPNFDDLNATTSRLQEEIEQANKMCNPDWLIYQLLLHPNAANILYNYPGRYERMMIAILNLARNVMPLIEDD